MIETYLACLHSVDQFAVTIKVVSTQPSIHLIIIIIIIHCHTCCRGNNSTRLNGGILPPSVIDPCRPRVCVSSDQRGLVRLWDVARGNNSADGRCVTTLEAHDGRVWSMALTADESGLYTGGEDGRLCYFQVGSLSTVAHGYGVGEVAVFHVRRSNRAHSASLLAGGGYSYQTVTPRNFVVNTPFSSSPSAKQMKYPPTLQGRG